jgi:hypothetical protein
VCCFIVRVLRHSIRTQYYCLPAGVAQRAGAFGSLRSRKMARRSGIDQLPATHQIASASFRPPSISFSFLAHRLKMDDGFAINCVGGGERAERTFAQPTHALSCGVFQQRINCTRWWSNLSPFIGKSQTPFVERGVNKI